MGAVAQEGRTVLFVSHQMNAIRALCERCLWLDGGRIARLGPTEEVVTEYLGRTGYVLEWVPREGDAPRDPHFTPLRLALVDEALQPVDRPVRSDERIGVLMEGDVERLSPALALGVAVYAPGGELLFWSLHTDGPPDRWPPLRPGRNRLVAWTRAGSSTRGPIAWNWCPGCSSRGGSSSRGTASRQSWWRSAGGRANPPTGSAPGPA